MRWFSILLLLGVGLAGCADDGPPGPGTPIAPDEGAIAGLLVDDRFRPIQLTDDPETEFQAKGFILLQETSETVQTTENGEFSFTGLEPGTYTLRASIEGHEASPQRVNVAGGQFSETTLLARRSISEGTAIITTHHAVFIPCAADYIVNGGNIGCDLDLSEEQYPSSFDSDLTGYEDLTYVVTELKANQESGYHVQIRPFSNPNYATAIWDGDYVKITLEKGQANQEWEEEVYGGPNLVFDNAQAFETVFFVEHLPFRGTVPLTCCGLGVTLGVKGQFIQSVFLGPPDVDIEGYCVLC